MFSALLGLPILSGGHLLLGFAVLDICKVARASYRFIGWKLIGCLSRRVGVAMAREEFLLIGCSLIHLKRFVNSVGPAKVHFSQQPAQWATAIVVQNELLRSAIPRIAARP